MGRVRRNIKVNGRKCWTLFDPGAENTYLISDIAQGLEPRRLKKVWPARLGGRVHRIHETCLLEAEIQGCFIFVEALVTDEIGYDKKAKRPFEILFGALSMQRWGIELDLKNEKLDMSRYPEEFVEF